MEAAAVILVAIHADQQLLAVVVSNLLAAQLLAVVANKPLAVQGLAVVVNKLVVNKLVVILADQLLVVHHRAVLKQLVVILVQLQLAIAVAVRRRSLVDFSPSYSDAKLRSLATKVHVMLVQHLAAPARLQLLQQQPWKQLQQQLQLQ